VETDSRVSYISVHINLGQISKCHNLPNGKKVRQKSLRSGGTYHIQLGGVASRIMFLKNLTSMQLVDSNRAAYWLQQGGFSWWCHVTNPNHSEVPFPDPAVSDKEIDQFKPRGLRKNRKALSAAKNPYMVVEWSDNSSDEDRADDVVEGTPVMSGNTADLPEFATVTPAQA
jgi:hypothetical protein